MTIADSALTRDVLRALARRPVDVSDLTVHVMHGVVYLGGSIRRLRGHHEEIDLRDEMNTIIKVLRQRPEISDISCEAEIVDAGRSELFAHRRR